MSYKRFASAGWAVAAVFLFGCTTQPDRTTSVVVVIPPGASVEAVADLLAERQVVRSARAFLWYARWTRADRELKPGTYEFPMDLAIAQVADRLRAGAPPKDTLVIPPGITLGEAIPIFEQLGIDSTDLMNAAESPRLRRRLGVPTATLEGYLLPGRHILPKGLSALEVLRRVTEAFDEEWRPEWQDQLDSLGMNRHDLVTLASIVEGEVRHDDERALVSSVYHNRLSSGMRLQADPTVIYALQERRRLYNRDYRVESPFNTYLVDGLPPHPINQPSVASIEAALYPTHSDFLYFVAGPNGRHHFSATYEEHLANIRRLRKEP